MFKYKRRIARIFKPSYFGKNQTTGDERKAKEFIKNYQSTLLTNYSYNDIKKMTNNFKEKLGEGGYGNVFKGKLPPDGRFIAVKMLMDYRDNSQNFLSEITSIEMVGAKTHAQPEANTSSEAQFSGWIYDKLMIGEERDNMELEDFAVGEEVYIARKMLKVGLWCIQINPKDRPSMTRVVEMLCGNAEAIEMPPKPIFFSPPRKQLEQETIISSNESESSVLALTSSRKWEP
ncbi:hypothetical protein CsSME_00022426 [Camellia sinensis var. sinensis]